MTTSCRVYKYELRDFPIETTTLGGFTWGQGSIDWTMLDVGVTRLFSMNDINPFAGASLGLHSVTVGDRHPPLLVTPYYSYYTPTRESKTTPTLDLYAGMLTMRTYDFQTVLEVRFHLVFDKFREVNGKGANGVMISFGTSH